MDPDLLAFVATVQANGVGAAARTLGLSQPALSARLKRLADSAGVVLFKRSGRKLELTASGTRLYEGALRVSKACDALEAALRTELTIDAPLRVGAADGIPKVVVRRVIEPFLRAGFRVECREWRTDLLEQELMAHRLEMLIADRPLLGAREAELQAVVQGRSRIMLCARKDLVAKIKADFPLSLARVPLALPSHPSPVRERIDRWLARYAPEARIVLEADDRALLHQAAAAGLVVAPVAKTVARTVNAQHGLAPVAELRGVGETYYLIRAKGRVPDLL
jgi:LysR family transcriptional activator of nhaA